MRRLCVSSLGASSAISTKPKKRQLPAKHVFRDDISPQLRRVLTPGSDSASSSKRRILNIAMEDLDRGSRVFRGHEPVKNSMMRHFTTYEAKEQIEHERLLRASAATGDYDGATTLPDAPTQIYFQLEPEGDLDFPFTFMTKATPGTELASLHVHMDVLRPESGIEESWDVFRPKGGEIHFVDSDGDSAEPLFRWYLASLVPTQFGPDFAVKVTAHVAVVPPEHYAWAEQNMVRLDEHDNGIVFFKKDVPYMAKEIVASAVFPYASPSDTKPLSVNLVLLSDLPLSAPNSSEGDEQAAFHSWSKGYRLRHSRSTKSNPRIECPDKRCHTVHRSIYHLKDHYASCHSASVYECDLCDFSTPHKSTLRRHVTVKHDSGGIECTEEGCEFVTDRAAYLKRHIAAIHQGVIFKCDAPGCEFTTVHERNLKRHMAAVHEVAVRHECPEEGCDYSSAYRGEVTRHVRAKHQDIHFPCPEDGCDFSTAHKKSLRGHIDSQHGRPTDVVELRALMRTLGRYSSNAPTSVEGSGKQSARASVG